MTRWLSWFKAHVRRGRLIAAGALVFGLLLLAASTAALNIALSDLGRARAEVSRNSDILERLAEIEDTVRAAETGQRGYLLTGEQRYLAPYQNALQHIWGRFDQLRELLRDPAQIGRLSQLRSLVDAKLRELAETVALRSQSFEAALDVVRTDVGQRLMEDIEGIIRTFREEQQHLLDRRVAEQERAAGWATGIASLTGVLALASAILGVVALVRERSQVRLIESEERFRNLAENIQEVFWIADPRSGMTLYVNPAFERVWGLPRESVYRDWRLWINAVVPEDRERVEAAFRECAAKGTYDEIYCIRRPDGSLRWIHDRGWAVRDRDGVLQYVVGVADDITEIRAAQDVLTRSRGELEERVKERTARLAEVNQELDTFAYSVSHDLRAPLRAMHGYADALAEDYGEMLPEDGQRYISRIAAAAVRMDHLIQDILAYSRLARQEVPLRRVSLEAAIDQVLVRASALISETRAKIAVDPPFPEVQGHMPTLVQAVENLISNALKFTAPDTSPRIRVWTERRGSMVRLWIEDEGIGIDQSHHERIFRPFERLHGVETYPGTGIGLAIVRKSAERMGGGSGVEASSGAGSRFWIELPMAEEET